MRHFLDISAYSLNIQTNNQHTNARMGILCGGGCFYGYQGMMKRLLVEIMVMKGGRPLVVIGKMANLIQ
jgi:hypothetical protein